MLAPWKESCDKPRQCIRKQRYHFSDKSLSGQSYGFPVVMYRCGSWTIKKSECQRIDAFKLWCWRTLESPLNCKEIKLVNPKGNQPWMFTGRTDAEVEAPILWPPDEKSRPWSWERLKVGGEVDDRGWDGWMASLTQWTWIWANSGRWWRTGKPGRLKFMESQRVGHNSVTEQQQQKYAWPELTCIHTIHVYTYVHI